MKYIKQWFLIIGISFLGEGFKFLFPFPMPASIYGLVLLFLALTSGILKVEQVKETADFLLEIMPMLFIPAAVGLLESWDILRPVLLPVAVITVATTVIVMVTAGHVTQFLCRRQYKK